MILSHKPGKLGMYLFPETLVPSEIPVAASYLAN